MGFLSTRGIEALEWGLRVTGLRQAATAQNLANLSTPGYKRVTVTFDRPWRDALEGAERGLSPVVTHPLHLGPGASAGYPAPRLQSELHTSARPDGNNVDLEYELATLSENTLHHQALLRQLNQRLAALRLAVTEGRK